jgi:hypothetical protein
VQACDVSGLSAAEIRAMRAAHSWTVGQRRVLERLIRDFDTPVPRDDLARAFGSESARWTRENVRNVCSGISMRLRPLGFAVLREGGNLDRGKGARQAFRLSRAPSADRRRW